MLELIAALCALLYVILAIREKTIAWLFAIICSALYVFVFYQVKLYLEACLQLFFIAMSVYGLIRWQSKFTPNKTAINKAPIKDLLRGCLLTGLLSITIGYFLSKYTDADLAYLDSLIACFSIYTTYLAAEKFLENWICWAIIDLVASIVYFTKDLHATAILYLLYIFLALQGYSQWKRKLL